MTAIFKKSFQFIDWRKDETTKRNVARQIFRVGPLNDQGGMPVPQNVPDWICDMDLYKAAVEEGSILEMRASAKAPVAAGKPSAANQQVTALQEEIRQLKEQLAAVTKPSVPQSTAPQVADTQVADTSNGKAKGKGK